MSPAPSDDPFFLDDPEYLHSPAHTRSPFDAAFDSPFSDPAQDPAPLMNPNLGPGFRGLGVCAKSLPDWAHADSLLGSHRPVVQRLGPGRVRVEFDSRRFIGSPEGPEGTDNFSTIEVDITCPGWGWPRLRCSCTTPDCPHRAMAAFALLTDRFRHDWRQQLRTVRSSTSPVEHASLGLVIRLSGIPMVPYDTDVAASVRPGLLTKKGLWNKSVTWASVLEGRHRGVRFEPHHVDVLHRLATMGDWSSGTLELTAIGNALWPTIAAAREVGMIVDVEDETGQHREVATVDDSEPAVQIPHLAETSDTDFGGITLHTMLTLPWDTHRFSVLSEHVIVAVTDTGVVIAPIECDSATRALADVGPVEIPEQDVPEFLHDEFGQLRSMPTPHITLSADRDAPAILTAVLHSRGVDGGQLRWEWDRDGTRHAWAHGTSGSPLQELADWSALAQQHPILIDWVGPPRELDAVESCRFGLDIVPILREDPRLDFEAHGEAVDYRLAENIDLEWDVTDSDDNDWFDLWVDVMVDGHQIPIQPLIRALVADEPQLVLSNGTVVDLTSERMQALRTLLNEAAVTETTQRPRISKHRMDLWSLLLDSGEARRTSPRWREQVEALAHTPSTTPPGPEILHATLRDYQQDGFAWLNARWQAESGGILADDMGLGKTLQILATIIANHQVDDDPVLVVAPRSVLSTWEEQAARFTPTLHVSVVTSGPDLDSLPDETDVVVVSHQLARTAEEWFSARTWSALIVDEAHVAKNPRTKLHRTLRRLQRSVTFALSGTPLENSLQDLWSLMEIAAPGALPDLAQFTRDFRHPIEREQDQDALQRLRRRLGPFMLRRSKELVARELPAKTEQTVPIELEAHRRVAYERQLNHERQQLLGLLDDSGGKVEILAGLTRLRKLAADPGTAEHPSSKNAFLIDQIQQLRAEGHRVLVFSQWASHLGVLADQLRIDGITHTLLDGSTSDREGAIAAFRQDAADVFLLSLKAGGVGLTLTEADYVFFLDPWWNPAVEAQAADRAHRIGQTRPVNVYRLVASGTIEEKVIRLQERKRQLGRDVLDGDGFSALGADDIRFLLDDHDEETEGGNDAAS